MKTILILVALTAAGWSSWHWLGPGARAATSVAFAAESIATAETKPIEIRITEDGYLKAKNSVEVKPEFEGQGKLTWLMEEGKAVKKGDKLAEFDKTDVQQRLDDTTNDLTVKETAAETARAELEIERRDGGAQVEAAEFTRSMAKMKLDKHVQGEGPNEKRKSLLAAEKAASEFERATERYQQVPDLAREGFLTKTQAEEEKIRLREAEINKENAEKDLELYTAYTEPMAIAELENAVKDTERVLTNAREKAQINLKDREARVTNADRQVKSTRQRLEKLQKHLEQLTIFSPIDGILHYGDPRERWWGEQIKVGNDVYSGNTLFTLPDLREMQAVVRVHEADIDQVKLEMPVTVTLESLKGRSLKGKITEIASVANSDWGEAKTFEVVVTLEPTEDSLRAGVTAKAEILVDTVPECLVIPIHAAFAENSKHFAFVLDGKGYEKREVELGKNNVYLVNITKGLSTGERVLLFDPRVSGSGGESSKDEPPAGKVDKTADASGPLSASGVGN
jgi:RND family efflux transporter MFP subunit